MVLGNDTELALRAKQRAVAKLVELTELDDATRHLDPESLMASPRDELGGVQQDDGSLTIGINTFHAGVRQRFSVAHEIGHAQLHVQDPKARPFVDPPARVLFRDGARASAKTR